MVHAVEALVTSATGDEGASQHTTSVPDVRLARRWFSLHGSDLRNTPCRGFRQCHNLRRSVGNYAVRRAVYGHDRRMTIPQQGELRRAQLSGQQGITSKTRWYQGPPTEPGEIIGDTAVVIRADALIGQRNLTVR